MEEEQSQIMCAVLEIITKDSAVYSKSNMIYHTNTLRRRRAKHCTKSARLRVCLSRCDNTPVELQLLVD